MAHSRTLGLLAPLLAAVPSCGQVGDLVPPQVGGDGVPSVVRVTDRGVRLAWAPASDNATGLAELRYCIYGRESTTPDGTKLHGCADNIVEFDVAGLRRATAYVFSISVQDQAGNRALYQAVTAETLRLMPVTFDGEALAHAGYFPAIADLNNDERKEALGTINQGNGVLEVIAPAANGLDGLFAAGRVQRDARLADFNGDGNIDVLANTYSSIDQLNSSAKLYFGNGNGMFVEDANFSDLHIRGYGETILVADFDNDSDLDVFIPYYSHNSTQEQSYLLVNDGDGRFVDVADNAGVALRGRPIQLRVEGAQAVDFDLDGYIDFYVGGHFFRNNGNLTFTDVRAQFRLPELFDEGTKFLDWNNDGHLDLVIHHPQSGPRLFQFDGNVFIGRDVIPSLIYDQSYGINISDLNNDGLEDIITSGGTIYDTKVLLNNGLGFERAEPSFIDFWGNDALAFADINDDGRLDILKREYGMLQYALNRTALTTQDYIVVEVLGSGGQKNQHGRVVKVKPEQEPAVIMTRVVDSGSGYLSQGQYELLIGTPYLGRHHVEVYFADRMISLVARPGDRVRVFADGRFDVF